MTAEYLSWVPADVDLTKPNPARIYDYLLGGANNFEVDRQFAKQMMAGAPDAPAACRENRAFLRRAVTFLAQQGIHQFLDLGSGIPTVGNTHEVVQAIDPAARIVYVDNEPVAVAHSELILQDNENADVIRADVRDVQSVLQNPVTRKLIDFDEPVAVLMFALLHFVGDDDEPHRMVRHYRDHTVPGSYLAVAHVSPDARPEATHLLDEYRERVAGITERPRAQIMRFFDGYDLVEPGLVFQRDWRPEIEVEYEYPSVGYCGVGLRI